MSWRNTSARIRSAEGLCWHPFPSSGVAHPRARLTEIRHRSHPGRCQDALVFSGVATERIEILTGQDAPGRRVSPKAMPAT